MKVENLLSPKRVVAVFLVSLFALMWWLFPVIISSVVVGATLSAFVFFSSSYICRCIEDNKWSNPFKGWRLYD